MTLVLYFFVEIKIIVFSFLFEGCFSVFDIFVSIFVIRIGKVMIIVNLFFYELEIVFRVFNDIFLLMSYSELIEFFKNFRIG